MQSWSSDLNALFSIQGLIGLVTLTILEIILGIDNIIFISIAVNKLPLAQQKKARTFGLSLALIVRTILLIFVGWIAGLKDALFMIGPYGISGKSIILIGGGLFLLIKTFQEIKEKIYNSDAEIEHIKSGKNTFNGIILQIIIIDFVFSFDSILAAVGISGVVLIMISAVLISMLLMILFSGLVSNFINKNKGIKTIALSFLLVIGGIILAEGIFDCYNFSVPEKEHLELNKNYAYIALAFALLVESFNLMEGKVKQKKDLEL